MGQFEDQGGFCLPRSLSTVQRRFVIAMLLEKPRGPAFGPRVSAFGSNRAVVKLRPTEVPEIVPDSPKPVGVRHQPRSDP